MSNLPLTSNRHEFDDATEAIEYYIGQGWTDGLPIVPPTPQRVSQFLEYTGLSPSEIVGAEPVKGRVITAEKVAINAVMAGCLPEHLPVVIAAVEAMSETPFNFHGVSVSTAGTAVLTVVSGPIAKELGVNSGVSVFGPGHRANATIGRAVRLIISNVTGAVPGVLDKSTLGHAGKYTWCIAEAEDDSPWEPLHVERGFSAGQNAVTVFAGLSPIQASIAGTRGGESVFGGLRDAMYAVGPGQEELVVVLSPEALGYIEPFGWSKIQVKEALFETTQRKVSDWIEAGAMDDGASPKDPDAVKGVAQSPDSFTLIVAGGRAGPSVAIIPLWGGGSNSRSVTKEIRTRR